MMGLFSIISQKTPDLKREQALRDFKKSPDNHYSALSRLARLVQENSDNPVFVATLRLVSNQAMLDLETPTTNAFKKTILATAEYIAKNNFDKPGVADYCSNILGLGLASDNLEIQDIAFKKATLLENFFDDKEHSSFMRGLLISYYHAFSSKDAKEKIIDIVLEKNYADRNSNLNPLKTYTDDAGKEQVTDLCTKVLGEKDDRFDLKRKAYWGLFYLLHNNAYDKELNGKVVLLLKNSTCSARDDILMNGISILATGRERTACELIKELHPVIDFPATGIPNWSNYVDSLRYISDNFPDDVVLKKISEDTHRLMFPIAVENNDEELLQKLSNHPDYTDKALRALASIPFVVPETGAEFDDVIGRLNDFIQSSDFIYEERGITSLTQFMENFAIDKLAQNPFAAGLIRKLDGIEP